VCRPKGAVPKGLQHQLAELVGVEKVRIRAPGSHSISGVPGIGWDGDLLPHLKAHLKIFWNLRQVACELVRG
jgi:hypothetical protein